MEAWQFGHSKRELRTVPAARAAARAARLSSERMSMSKRRFAASGLSLATVRVFSPITQLGASGTRQPHSGHLVSVQYRKASARQPCSSCSMPHSVTCASTVWNTAFCAARTSLATFSPPPTMLSAPQVRSAATGFKSDP